MDTESIYDVLRISTFSIITLMLCMHGWKKPWTSVPGIDVSDFHVCFDLVVVRCSEMLWDVARCCASLAPVWSLCGPELCRGNGEERSLSDQWFSVWGIKGAMCPREKGCLCPSATQLWDPGKRPCPLLRTHTVSPPSAAKTPHAVKSFCIEGPAASGNTSAAAVLGLYVVF